MGLKFSWQMPISAANESQSISLYSRDKEGDWYVAYLIPDSGFSPGHSSNKTNFNCRVKQLLGKAACLGTIYTLYGICTHLCIIHTANNCSLVSPESIPIGRHIYLLSFQKMDPSPHPPKLAHFYVEDVATLYIHEDHEALLSSTLRHWNPRSSTVAHGG